MMKLLIFLYKQKLLCDNKSMKSLQPILFNQLIMVRACLSVRTAALVTSVINPWPSFYSEVLK